VTPPAKSLLFDSRKNVVIIFPGDMENTNGRPRPYTKERVMLKRYAFIAVLAVAAAGAFAGQVETGAKDVTLKLPFCGT